MKTLIFTISLLIFSSMAAFNSCAALTQRDEKPRPDDNTRITAPNEDEQNGVNKQHRMPRFVPRFYFDDNNAT